MKITPKTKISALIKANPASIEAITSISSHFEKLRNPILRKILASRVTIADAARIGGAEVAVFFQKLEAIGFEPESDSEMQQQLENLPASVPQDLPAKHISLDAREAIETGNDPFSDIIAALENLKPHQALKLINTFEPTPLLEILSKRGYRHYTDILGPELVYTFFYKPVAFAAENKVAQIEQTSIYSFQEKQAEYQDKLLEIDVRQLEMPLPMVTILGTLPKLQTSEALLVHLHRVPQHLLPQLLERGFAYAIKEENPEKVELLIFKKP